MTEKKSPVISFKDFSFQYRAQKKPTLTGINLDIYPGEKVLTDTEPVVFNVNLYDCFHVFVLLS